MDKKKNRLMFKIKIPDTRNMTFKNYEDMIKKIDEIRVDVVEYQTGKKLGRYSLSEIEIKFS
jgi:hypothetical protein